MSNTARRANAVFWQKKALSLDFAKRQSGKPLAVHSVRQGKANIATLYLGKGSQPFGGLAFHPADKRLPLLQIFGDAGGRQIKQRHAVGGSLDIQLRVAQIGQRRQAIHGKKAR